MCDNIEAFEYLDKALELFVSLQFEGFPFSCGSCSDIDREDNFCGYINEAGEEAVYYSKYTDKEYTNCPLSMIPSLVYKLHDNYEHIQEMGSPKSEKNINPLQWWFVKRYKYYKSVMGRKK